VDQSGDQVVLQREKRYPRPGRDARLLVDVYDVGVGGPSRDDQPLGNLALRGTPRKQLEHLHFALGQPSRILPAPQRRLSGRGQHRCASVGVKLSSGGGQIA
jgi:hypothetical protein